MTRQRHTPDQIIRKLAEGNKLLAGGAEVVGQHRSTQRLDPPTRPDDDAELRAWPRAFSTERPRWGWRRAYKQLRREGRRINKKRVQRLWRAEGLKVPYRKRKKRHRGVGVKVGQMCPIRPDVLWALDTRTRRSRRCWAS